MLRIWLNLNGNREGIPINPTQYELVWIQEKDPFDASNSSTVVRNWLRNCYASPEEVSRRVAAGAHNSPEELYQLEKFPRGTNLMVRHGDFGEAVGHFILEAHPSFRFCLPVYRLRSKDDKEKSHFGFDLIGFKFAEENNGQNALCIGEAKLRTSKDDNAIAEAHSTLAGYDRLREIEQIGRVAHLLFDQHGSNEANKLARFGEGWAKEEFDRQHVAIAVVDATMSLDGMLRALDRVHAILPSFCLCLILIKDLRLRIEEAFQP